MTLELALKMILASYQKLYLKWTETAFRTPGMLKQSATEENNIVLPS